MEKFYIQHGTITSIRTFNKHVETLGFGYAIVKMEDGRYGETVILNRNPDLIRIEVYPKLPIHRTLFQLSIVQLGDHPGSYFEKQSNSINIKSALINKPIPKEDSPSNILNALNNDILQEIFKLLPLADLCSVAEVCKLFQANAKENFKLEYKEQMIEVREPIFFECLLRNFGNELQSLSIRSFERDEYYMHLYGNTKATDDAFLLLTLALNCSGPNCQLKYLNLSNFNIAACWYDLMQPIFYRLERLRMHNSEIGGLLRMCNKLTELNLMGPWTTNFESPYESLSVGINKLTKLTIWNVPTWRPISENMNINESLTVLKILESSDCHLTIQEISTMFPNLEILYLYAFHKIIIGNGIISALARMNHLKTIAINDAVLECQHTKRDLIDCMIQAKVNIERLILTSPNPATLVKISNLKQLKVLQITGFIKEIHDILSASEVLTELYTNLNVWNKILLKMVLKRGKQLSFIFCGNWESGDCILDHDYDEILSTIKKHKKNEKVIIQIRSDEMLMVVDKCKIKEYRNLMEFRVSTAWPHSFVLF